MAQVGSLDSFKPAQVCYTARLDSITARPMQVKICGITRPHDGVAAIAAGADALGLVLWPGSKRAVNLQQARAVCRELPPFATVVALMVNPTSAEVDAALAALPINVLQFHGDETADFCERWAVPYIKALRAQVPDALLEGAAAYPKARGFLVDSVHNGQFGGTGRAFDWSLLPRQFPHALVLAGGLDPDNVANAVRFVQPAAVDVSSGVESAPGIKDDDKMRRFVAAAKTASKELTP